MGTAFIYGFLLAFGLIMPLGVQNVFILNQGALQPSFLKALPAILTACLCDTILILLAVLGVSFVVLEFVWLKVLLLSVGIVFLIYMGFVTWRSVPKSSKEENPKVMSPKKQVAFAASVSLLNPHAILDTIGVIGTSSLKYTGGEKWMFTFACILVSYLWFFGLATIGRIIGQRDRSGRVMGIFNKLSAIIIWGAAIFMASQLLEA